jgi:Uncharacterized protein conserved in bacteria
VIVPSPTRSDGRGSIAVGNVGLPRDIEWRGRTVHTGIWKRGHGGEHRAVFVYQIESYRYWQKGLGRSDFVYGQFGENFTVEGMPDDAVCIGDRYRIGSARRVRAGAVGRARSR